MMYKFFYYIKRRDKIKIENLTVLSFYFMGFFFEFAPCSLLVFLSLLIYHQGQVRVNFIQEFLVYLFYRYICYL
jgi:hypothetical protein